MVSEAVEPSPVGTKPPAAVDERISMDGRHDSDAAGSLSTATSSLQGRAGGSAFTPKLVELVVGQKSHPDASLVLLLRRPPCAHESS